MSQPSVLNRSSGVRSCRRELYDIVISGALLLCCYLPLINTVRFLRLFLAPSLPRSWDGSGHLAASYIYDATVFPDTYGWTHMWFGGMPLPNFYPPLFYWIVAMLHHAGLPLLLAVKIGVTIPFLLIPASLGFLSWRLTSRDTIVASCTALATFLPLLDLRLESGIPVGLDYTSTYNEGLYTQPLGFVLLVAWISFLFTRVSNWKHFAITAFLLTLVLLASFFSVVAVLPFGCVGLVYAMRRRDEGIALTSRLQVAQVTLICLTIACAIALSAFWTVPVLQDYSFFVTRPAQEILLRNVIRHGPGIVMWYAAALTGAVVIALRGTAAMRAFIVGCGFLLVLILLSFASVLPWLPSQPHRLVSTFNLLLAVPVGYGLAIVLRWAANALCSVERKSLLVVAAGLSCLSVALSVYIRVAPLDKVGGPIHAIYLGEPSIAEVLTFAKEHKDGRYIVESPFVREDTYDARALRAYLAMQGNESLTVVFHEASPSSVFFNPLVNALSASRDDFGISSALARDLDFYNQRLEQQLARARGVGVRYVVCVTPSTKLRLRQQPNLVEYQFGRWSVFQIVGAAAPEAEVLRYLPALVVSPIDFKQRREGDYSFTRLAEEQFGGWQSDVLLVHAGTKAVDKLTGLENFGALVLDTYYYDDEKAAYERLRKFSQDRPLILLSSRQPLYLYLEKHLSELPHGIIVQRNADKQPEWFGGVTPWQSLNRSNLRKEWRFIEGIIESSRTPVHTDELQAALSHDDDSFSVAMTGTSVGRVPLLIRITFHPGWTRTDGEPIYPATPFFMLTFANGSFQAKFQRDAVERLAVGLSGSVFSLLVLVVAWETFATRAGRARALPTQKPS